MTQSSGKAHPGSDCLVTADILATLVEAVDERGTTASILEEMRRLEPHLLDALEELFVGAVGRAVVHAEGMSPKMLAAFHTEHATVACFVFAAMRKAWAKGLSA